MFLLASLLGMLTIGCTYLALGVCHSVVAAVQRLCTDLWCLWSWPCV
jgi:hypothetical protein